MTATESEKNKTAGPEKKPAKVRRRRNALLALVLGWAVPGLGHVYARDYFRGAVFFLLIVGAIAISMEISDGEAIGLTFHEISFIGQAGAGAPVLRIVYVKKKCHRRNLVKKGSEASSESIREFRKKKFIRKYSVRGHINPWAELGLLLATVAGLLNILIALDAAVTAGIRDKGTRKQGNKEPKN